MECIWEYEQILRLCIQNSDKCDCYVIGDSNVGKTCLTFRFCAGRFPEKTEATIGVDFREKTVIINDTQITVCKSKSNIWL